MGRIFLNDLGSNEIFTVLIKWKSNSYYTGFYYNKKDRDCLFHSYKNIECFKTLDDLIKFFTENNLHLNNDVAEYDFDIMPSNPIDYSAVLNKWNILNTISTICNSFFEGNKQKYNKVYDYLFSCNFAVKPLPMLYKIPIDYYHQIIKVFKKQFKVLNKIKYFEE